MSSSTSTPAELGAALEDAFGYRFLDPSLAILALTHSSQSNERGREDNYERLEFLGDAVLGLVASQWLYRTFPRAPEGELAKLKSFLVSTPVLADFARSVDLGSHLRLGVGEERSGGREKISLLADGVEALFGAIYLEGGLDAALPVVEKVVESGYARRHQIQHHDAKTRLQELAQGAGMELPVYELVGESGPDHN
ncbi:MAG: ribonuclease III, partial [Acidobacteriota bacterium]